MKKRHLLKKIQDARNVLYIEQWHFSPLQSRPHTLGPHTVFSMAISCPVIFYCISSMVWNLFSFKGDFSFGRNKKSQDAIFGLHGDWVPWVIWYFTKISAPDMMHEQACCHDEAANHQLPTAVAFWSIWSFHRGMFKLNTKFDADSLLYSLSHFECNSYTVHMLTQWCLLPSLTSAVKSSLFTHAHSSPLSLAARLRWCFVNCSYHINNGWTFFQIDLIYLIRFI